MLIGFARRREDKAYLMAGEKINAQPASQRTAGPPLEYDPFLRGRFPVGVRTIEALDAPRGRLFPCEIWYPAAAHHAGQDVAPATRDHFTVPASGALHSQMAVRNAAPRSETFPLVLFSHHSGGHRRAATFLCTHLSSHGYVVAALDHSEVVATELARRDDENREQKAARVEAVIASRVPDIRFLLDCLRGGATQALGIDFGHTQIGIVGHSFGGWAALAAPDVERSICAVVALAPGGNSQPRPGILPVKLAFAWDRDVPALYLVAENDVPLRRADHLHFIDNVEEMHEIARKMQWPEEVAWIQREMRPIAELCSGEQAHVFVRGLTLCHLDATVKRQESALRFLAGDLEAALAVRGVDVVVHQTWSPAKSTSVTP